MNKKFSFWLLFIVSMVTVLFNSCTNFSSQDKGVVINGVKWATCNVDKPGTFVAKPENIGMYYQWNRKVAQVDSKNVTNDNTYPTGRTWEKSNDPSPTGWRVPTLEEVQKLFDYKRVSQENTIVDGVFCSKFTDKETGNSIIIPSFNSRGSAFSYWSSTQRSEKVAYGFTCGSNSYGSGTITNGTRSWYNIRSVAE